MSGSYSITIHSHRKTVGVALSVYSDEWPTATPACLTGRTGVNHDLAELNAARGECEFRTYFSIQQQAGAPELLSIFMNRGIVRG